MQLQFQFPVMTTTDLEELEKRISNKADYDSLVTKLVFICAYR